MSEVPFNQMLHSPLNITQAVGVKFHTSLSLAQVESGSLPDASYTIISSSLPIYDRKVDNIVHGLAKTKKCTAKAKYIGYCCDD